MNNEWDIHERDPGYETCERTFAMLQIFPKTESASIITSILGVIPTRSGDIGRGALTKGGVERIAGKTFWLLSTEDSLTSLDLRDHIDLLLSKIDDRIYEVQKLPFIKMTVGCVWWSTGSGGPCLSSYQMAALGRLNLECCFDISFFGDEED